MSEVLREFVTSPASWISLAALALTVANRVSQSRQWTLVNRARIRPMAATLRTFHMVDAKEARTKDWKYVPILHSIPGDAEKVAVGSRLVLIDPSTGTRILGPHTLFDMSDAESEAATASKAGPASIAKQMEFVWGFVNDGALPAEEVRVEQEVGIDGVDLERLPQLHEQKDLKRGEEVYLQPWMVMELDHLPTSVRMRVTISYRSDGRLYREVFATEWNSARNTWTRTE